jgi:hypothetical protein
MVIFGSWNGQTLTLSLKPNSLTLSLQGQGQSQVYSFDAAGRLWTAMREDVSYRRGLNGRTVAKWQTTAGAHVSAGGEGRERRWLSPAETARLEERARQMVSDLLSALDAGAAQLKIPLPAQERPLLEAAACFIQERYQADVAHYHQVYKPVGILPPDQYMAVVLQATEGCSFNTCTFCTFYRDRPFRIRRPEDFRTHALAVKDFLGAGLSLRRTVFLGDANALVVPQPRLLELLDVVHQAYDVEKLGGIYAFLDGFSGEKKTAHDFRVLAERGLKRVYIGMESGKADLLRLLKKPGRPEDVLQAVRAMKEGGVSVGIIVLLGAGGKQHARGHVQDTVRALNSMPLDMDDLVYFSELVESEGMEYTRDAYALQLQPLTPAERIRQGEEIESQLRFGAQAGTPHISRYDIREFVY